MPSIGPNNIANHPSYLYLIIGILVFIFLSFGAGFQESETYDEPSHIAAGFLYWKTGQYKLQQQAPFNELWMTWPLLTTPLEYPSSPPPWAVARNMRFPEYLMNHDGLTPGAILAICRFMNVVLGAFLAFLIWRWSAEAVGTRAAIAALTAYVFNPNILAYSHLATADMGAAVFTFLSIYLFWRLWRHPQVRRAIMAGIGLGLNVAGKLSGLLIVPLLGIMIWMEHRAKSKPLRSRSVIPLIVSYVMAALAALVLCYGVVNFPSFFIALRQIGDRMTQHVPHYFHGHIREGSWVWFSTAVMLLKTPLPFMLMCGLPLLAEPTDGRNRFGYIWLLIPSLGFLAVLSLSPIQFGVRRLLVLYPFLAMWIGLGVDRVWSLSARWRALCCLMAGWYIASAIAVFPRYLSYFNEMAGGPSQGHRFLVDCNLDWGQGMKALQKYLKTRGTTGIYLSYFGSADPHSYGIRYVAVAPKVVGSDFGDPGLNLNEQPRKLFVISATNRAGLYYVDHHVFDWLLPRRPLTVLMDSLWVYDMTNDLDGLQHLNSLIAQKNSPRLASYLSDQAASR